MLDNKEIPFHTVGSHRRVESKDLGIYRRGRSQERRSKMANLYERVEVAGVYDHVPSDDDES